MTPELWIAVTGLVLTGLAMAGAIIGSGVKVVTRISRAEVCFGQRLKQIEERIDGINHRLDRLNGSVAENTKRSHENQLEIARIKERLKMQLEVD